MDAGRFSARLKELREQAGLSQKELADRAGLSQKAISHWEQALRDPSWPNVVALATALGVSTEAFLEEPRGRPPQGRGRPPKAKEEEPPAPKRRRGRPRKGE
jgi:transcriptional regulator with XRE-family HTH domain